jgi:hypothetical protein
MVGLLWEVDIRPLPEFIDTIGQGNLISSNQVHPEFFLPYVEAWFDRDARLTTDILQSFSPAFGFPWVEAILGCPLIAGQDSIWSLPILRSYTDWAETSLSLDNPWFCKLMEFTQVLVNYSAGRFPISLPPIHSPLDLLGAIRGDQQMLLDLVDQHDAVQKILTDLTQVYFSIIESCLDIIPPFAGGYTTRLRMWAPGKAITPQNEYASMISTRMYREFALPIDRVITEHFPYHSFHLHGSAQHQINNLLTLEQLTSIQITLEHNVGGPSLEEMLPRISNILKLKPVICVVPDIATAEICSNELPPEGLMILLLEGVPELDEKYDAWLRAKVRDSGVNRTPNQSR